MQLMCIKRITLSIYHKNTQQTKNIKKLPKTDKGPQQKYHRD